jgi:hypothetical protein
MIPSALVPAPDTCEPCRYIQPGCSENCSATAVVPTKQPDARVEDTTTAKPIAERKPTDDNDLGYI